MDGKVSGHKGGSKDEACEKVKKGSKVENAEPARRSQEGAVNHAEPNNTKAINEPKTTSTEAKFERAEAVGQKDGKVEQDEESNCKMKEEEVKRNDSTSKPKGIKVEGTESTSQSKAQYVKGAESTTQTKTGRVDIAEPTRQSGKTGKIAKAQSAQEGKYQTKRKNVNKSKATGVDKLKGGFRSFRETAKKFWDVWSRFKTKNTLNPNPTKEKTLGVPGFEEIACIEAEVPDIMMMDKDRVRTSCKECMIEEPAFPTQEQIKAKLIAADKYYGVERGKTKSQDTLEHEADYYDTDGRVVRPSWRFILERPLVEQYVLMTNYIRKLSVLSELRENKAAKKCVEEEDSGSDTEYKKFEQKFIREKGELLKPMQKPKTREMAVQTSLEPERDSGKDLKESVSEISLYPETEDSTNSPDASAVTIVTSRDYTSPLQSDFDGRTTDKSTSVKGQWWEPPCEPSESFQTSYDSINKNTSSGSDGQNVPVHSVWGNTALQPAREEFSNESDSRISTHNRSVEPKTHTKPKDSKKVSFSPLVTYYQGPSKTLALYNVVESQDIEPETSQVEPQQGVENKNPKENKQSANQTQNRALSTEDKTNKSPPKGPAEERPMSDEELPNDTPTVRTKQSNRKVPLEDILRQKKRDQIVSVSVPVDWHEDRILRDKKTVKVSVSRSPTSNPPMRKRLSFQEYGEIPDVEYSNPNVSTVVDKTDANIQTQTSDAEKSAVKSHPNTLRGPALSKQAQDNTGNPRNPQIQALDESAHLLENMNELNLSGRHWREENRSTGTETNVRAALPRVTQLETRWKTIRKTDQTFDGHRAKPMLLVRANTSKVQSLSIPNNDVDARATMRESIVCPQPKTAENSKDVYIRSNDNVDPQRTPRIPPSTPMPHVESRQHHSTDTEGPSSSSNEHIKLKASPPCFFKVATPPDLSRISVDEFYPDVPEIDAEISKMSETKSQSAPQVEIVFPNKESALRYIQDAEFHRISKKEENTMLQKSVKTTQNDNPTTFIAPNKGKTIVASAGVGIKIAEDTEKHKRQSGNVGASKALTKDSGQQSTITQHLGKISLIGKSLIEPDGEIKEKVRQTRCSADLPSPSIKQEKTHSKEEHGGKIGEAKVRAKPVDRDEDMKSRGKVKIDVTTQPTSDLSVAPHRFFQVTGLPGKDTVPEKNPVNERCEGAKPIEKGEEVEKRQDDDILQRQSDSVSTDPQLSLHGRTKLYMRTLSSLAEETSSMVEATSSTQDKLVDMPTVERPVGELKTIFEKPAGSDIRAEGSRIEPKNRVGSLTEKLDNKYGISDNKMTTADDHRTTRTKHLADESERKFTNPTEEPADSREPQVVEPRGSTPTDSNQPKHGPVQADKPIKSESSQSGRDIQTRSALLRDESSAQQLSQIDVIRASEIYSNTSMYFSSSEDPEVKLTKARTGFQPVTFDNDLPGNTRRDTEKEDAKQSDPIANADDNPPETKHWLMDVIPVLSKNARYRGFRPHKAICVKEATEAEAVKYRQDAVKPVFKFLKRQREM